MTQPQIKICEQLFNKDIEYFSFKFFSKISDMSELSKLKEFTNLKSTNFTYTNINDSGLQFLSDISNIESLDLQDTKISNIGLSHLYKLKNLKNLRLKENKQLDNGCIEYLNNINKLENLQLHETSITQEGLKNLNIQTLRDLLIDEIDKEALINLSLKLPKCSILIKGKAFYLNGKSL